MRIAASRHRLEAAGFAIVLALAAWARLGQPGVSEFRLDEARAMLLAMPIFEQGQIPLFGMPASVGTSTPPLFIYLVALPLAFGRNALLAMEWAGLLNVAAVVVAIVLLARHLGRVEALVGGLLYATSYWAIAYGRKVWQPSFVPLFSALFLLATLDFVRDGKRASLGWAIAWLGLAIQIHFAAVVYVPVLVLAMLMRWRNVAPKAVFAGLVVPVLVLTPFLIWQAGHGFHDIVALVTLGGDSGPLDWGRLRIPFLLVGARQAYTMAGPRIAEFLVTGPNFDPLFILADALVLAGISLFAGQLFQALRRRDRGAAMLPVVMLTTALAPMPIYLRASFTFNEHYVVPLYPVQFLLIGAAVGAIVRWLERHRVLGRTQRAAANAGLVSVAAVVIVLSSASLWTFVRVWSWIDTVDIGYFGLPLNRQIAAAEMVRNDLELDRGREQGLARQTERLLLAATDIDSVGAWPKTFDFLLGKDVTIQPVDADGAVVFPRTSASPVRYLSPTDTTRAGQFLQAQFRDSVVGSVPYPGGSDAIRLYRLPPDGWRQAETLRDWQLASLTWTNGVRVAGYRFDASAQSGQTLVTTLLWSTGEAAHRDPSASYRFSLQLIDAAGKRIANVDTLPFPVDAWGQDDFVISWHPLRLTGGPSSDRGILPGRYRLRLSMYDLRNLAVVPLQNSDTFADLGWVRIHPEKSVEVPATAIRPVEPANLVNGVELVASELLSEPMAGQPLRVRLYWRTAREVPTDLTVFVHLAGADGQPIAQHDGPPAGGNLPTSSWAPGEIVVDDHVLVLPQHLSARSLRLRVGMYQPATGQRLLLADGRDAIELEALTAGR